MLEIGFFVARSRLLRLYTRTENEQGKTVSFMCMDQSKKSQLWQMLKVGLDSDTRKTPIFWHRWSRQ